MLSSNVRNRRIVLSLTAIFAVVYSSTLSRVSAEDASAGAPKSSADSAAVAPKANGGSAVAPTTAQNSGTANAGAANDTKSRSGNDETFSNQQWAIVPAGQASTSPRQSKRRPQSNFVIQTQFGNSAMQPSTFMTPMPSMSRPAPVHAYPPVDTKTIKLYGRVEELATAAGAKIPLKMVAMTPIRDTSLDAKAVDKPVKLAGKAQTQTAWLTPQKGFTDRAPSVTERASITSHENVPEPTFPVDFRGTWSGQMTVSMVDFDPSYFDFDRAEAEKQQKLVTPGTTGNCTVTFYDDGEQKIAMQPTQVVFSTMANAGEEMKSLANSPYAALLGGAGAAANLANNPMLANLQIPIQFVLPLGSLGGGGNMGVTGNQIGSELMKNALKQISKNVLEQQVVTKDSDKKSSGESKTMYAESDLNFTRINDSQLYLQAAAVTYDMHGKYMNKVILKGTLERGAGASPPVQSNPLAGLGNFGAAQTGADGGAAAALGALLGGGGGGAGGAGAANPLGALLGGMGGGNGGAGAANPLGALLGGMGGGNGGAGAGAANPLSGLFGGGSGAGNGTNPLGGLFGGSSGGQNGGAAGQSMVEQMQQAQKMLQDMDK